MAATETEVLKHSVTSSEVSSLRANNIFIPVGYQGYALPVLPDLPLADGRHKDTLLYSTVKSERTWWGSGIKTAISQEASMSWTVDSDIELRAARGQDLLHTINGRKGWVEFVQRHLRDYLTTNNGSFIEVVRASSSISSRIIGLMHLSSLRCSRTGDQANPVAYTDMLGQEHLLKDYQVLYTSDGVESDPSSLGYGTCAAETCYNKIQLLQAVEGSILGKIKGTRTQALDFLMGISENTVRLAVDSAEAERLSRGIIHYKGVTLVPFMGEKLEHVRIDYAGIPDNFNRELETKLALMSFALAMGLDFQDLYPESVPGGMNTSSQSRKLHEAARGKGLAVWEKWIEWVFNEYVLPQNTVFTFSERDYQDEKSRADISKVRTDDVAAKIQAGIITPDKATRILVEQAELPKWVLPDMAETQNLSLDDTEKPVEDAAPDPGAEQQDAPVTALAPEAVVTAITGKERKTVRIDIDALIESEMEAAIKAYKELPKSSSKERVVGTVLRCRAREGKGREGKGCI